MGIVLPASSSAADATTGLESRKRRNCPVGHAGIVGANRQVCTRTRTSHHRRHGYADRHEPEHAQAALPPTVGKGGPGHARPRRLVCWHSAKCGRLKSQVCVSIAYLAYVDTGRQSELIVNLSTPFPQPNRPKESRKASFEATRVNENGAEAPPVPTWAICGGDWRCPDESRPGPARRRL